MLTSSSAGVAQVCAVFCYPDVDDDGYGNKDAPVLCRTNACIEGEAENNSDCNDANAAISPADPEICDAGHSVDENCNGSADDNDPALDPTVTPHFYKDSDGDGYGAGAAKPFCVPETGYVTRAGDCNDASQSIHPGKPEICDAGDVDENCNGSADDDDPAPTNQSTWFSDFDGDEYGAAPTLLKCDKPTNKIARGGDCDDTNAAVRPGANEVCDDADVDEDCDGEADDADSSTLQGTKGPYYIDGDEDGFGAGSVQLFCDAAVGRSALDTDCNDDDPRVSPSAREICNGVDDNCVGGIDDAIDCGTAGSSGSGAGGGGESGDGGSFGDGGSSGSAGDTGGSSGGSGGSAASGGADGGDADTGGASGDAGNAGGAEGGSAGDGSTSGGDAGSGGSAGKGQGGDDEGAGGSAGTDFANPSFAREAASCDCRAAATQGGNRLHALLGLLLGAGMVRRRRVRLR